MDDKRCVLIVDRSEETREVLRTALGRRGVRTIAASRAAPGLELARQHHPDLIVLDLELDGDELGADSGEDVSAPFAEQSRCDHSPLVMLGSVRRASRPGSDGDFVAKPYHYGPLIRRIEELLDQAPPALARSA